MRLILLAACLFAVIALAQQEQANAPQQQPKTPPAEPTYSFSPDALKTFTALNPIDTHAHVFQRAAAFNAMLRRMNMTILDICVVSDESKQSAHLQPHLSQALNFVRHSDGRAQLCTTFDPYKFNDPNFSTATVKQLNRNFAQGAIAVKIWKNVGMEIKDAAGKFVMADDPKLEPVYQDIASHNKTLVAHLAEPDSCWLPPNPASPDYEYYNEHPEWYMYRHPDHPSKQTILAARDHVLEMNPSLRVVGAHLGSMESDLDDIGRHLDKYPNFAVDMAARIPYFLLGDHDRVRDFIIKYQDRLTYATDLDFGPRGASKQTDQVADTVREWESTYARDWRFFASDETLQYRGKEIRGLKLPDEVLRKIYHDNAVKWFPGIVRQ